MTLSDLAAKGAVPHAYLLTIALPHNTSLDWLRDFASGLSADQQTCAITLLGGDTTATSFSPPSEEGALSSTSTRQPCDSA